MYLRSVAVLIDDMREATERAPGHVDGQLPSLLPQLLSLQREERDDSA
jgi:hypothetical protein